MHQRICRTFKFAQAKCVNEKPGGWPLLPNYRVSHFITEGHGFMVCHLSMSSWVLKVSHSSHAALPSGNFSNSRLRTDFTNHSRAGVCLTLPTQAPHVSLLLCLKYDSTEQHCASTSGRRAQSCPT